MNLTTLRHRRALFLLFWLPGFALASFVTRTPAIRDRFDATTAEMGLLMFGLSVGAMSGILASNLLVHRLGTRGVIWLGTGSVIIGVGLVGVGSATTLAEVIFCGLLIFGIGMGANEIALNIEGAQVERMIGKPALPALHGFFSLGTAVGAVVGIALTALNFSVTLHVLLVSAACIPALALVHQIPAGYRRQQKRHASALTRNRAPSFSGPSMDRGIIYICLVALAIALAEGAATDWLPLLMVDGHGFAEAEGSIVYAAFAISMTVGRFAGSFFLGRFPRDKVFRASALIAAAGIAIVIFTPNPLIAGVAVLFWGAGTSIGFPAAVSAAGDRPGDPASAVGLVATAGSLALLTGPPLLGFLGQLFTLRGAMVIVLALILTAAAIAPVLRLPSRTSSKLLPTKPSH